MKIYLENCKYEYELKTLIQSNNMLRFELEFMVLENIPRNTLDDYIGIYRHPSNLNTVCCEYQIQSQKSNLNDKIRPNELTEKNSYKRLLYQVLNKHFDFNLDWGILTGIRPTKLFNEYSIQYDDENQRDEDFANDFYVSENKIRMLSQVDQTQNLILGDIDRNNYSVYLSVPFCPSKCSYCTFFSNDINLKSKLVAPYIESINKEMESILASPWIRNKKLDSVYFGGGTPSSLNLEELKIFLKNINDIINLKLIKEVTFEAGRPDTIDIHKLQLLKSYGINRISINPQTMVDTTLKAIGRNHTSNDIIQSFNEARAAGFDNINMDIILGLENETLDDLKHTLDELLKLNPESITMHSLSLKKTSDLTKKIDSLTFEKQNKVIINMIDFIYKEMKNNGYHPYYLYRQKNILGGQENIGFAKKGYESLYNMFIIEEYQNILSFGPGAISRYVFPEENRVERISNTKNLEEYTRNLDKYINKKLEMQV